MNSSRNRGLFLVVAAATASTLSVARAQDTEAATAKANSHDDATSRGFKLLGKNAIWTNVSDNQADLLVYDAASWVSCPEQ